LIIRFFCNGMYSSIIHLKHGRLGWSRKHCMVCRTRIFLRQCRTRNAPSRRRASAWHT
jgi:hypothetical protein